MSSMGDISPTITNPYGYNSEMLDLESVIVPAKAAGRVSIGSAVSDFLSFNRPQSTTQLADGEKHDFGAVQIWVKNGIVTQVGVYSGYEGMLQSAIRIGSTIADIEDCFGCSIGPTQRTSSPGLHSVRTTTSAEGNYCGGEPERSKTGPAIYSAWQPFPSIIASHP